MDAFVQTEIGYLPETWHLQRLGDVFETQLGKMLSQKAHGGDAPKPYLRNKNVQWGSIDTSDVLEMDFSDREKAKFQLRPGDLLVCEGGVPGRAAIWNGAIEECYYQKALHRLRPRNGSMINQFMLHWFRFAFDLQNLYGVSGASSTIAHLPEAQLKALLIPVPPLPEQRKIAEVLGLVQRAMGEQERLIALSTELKKALLRQLFTHGIRGEPQEQTEIGCLPQSWEVAELGDYLTEAQYGISAKGSESGPYAVLRMTNQRQGRISSDNLQYVELTGNQFQRFRVERHDILFNRTNSFELVGRTAIFDLEGDFVFASYLIRLRTDGECLRPFFLNHYLNWEETQRRLKSIASRAVSQSNISATRLRSFSVPVPKADEQDEIVANLDCLDQMLSINARKHVALTALFRTLLHQLMTARIRVHNLVLSEP